jgi:riboflavin kinase
MGMEQEVHILYKFPEDFYGSEMAISILGFIRPEYDYVSVQSLIEDINEDIEVTKRSLDREKWKEAMKDRYLWGEEPENA